MMRIRNSVILSLLLFSAKLVSQPAVIKGCGEGYGNVELFFFRLSDPVSHKLIPLQVVKCNEKGEFFAEISLKERSRINIKTGIYNFILLASPGKEYLLKLPPCIPKPEGGESNPFITERNVIPEVINDSTDINNLIRRFDEVYNPVFNRVSEHIAKGLKKDEIPGIISSLNKVTENQADPFYSDFVIYRMIMLNAVAYGEFPDRREDSVLINRNFMPDNPAYTDLVEQLYGNCFKAMLTSGMRDVLIRALENSSPMEIRKIFTREGKIINRQLQDYVILENIYSGFYEGFVKDRNVYGILDSLISEGGSDYIRNLASLLKNHILFFSPGTYPPEFSLPDSTGEKVTPVRFRGKFVLLLFIRDTDYAALSELSLLKSWAGRFENNLSIVAVITGPGYREKLRFFMKRNYGWTFLDASESPFISYYYDLKVYPSFFLLDREGKIAVKYCPAPSENLEVFIRNILEREGK